MLCESQLAVLGYGDVPPCTVSVWHLDTKSRHKTKCGCWEGSWERRGCVTFKVQYQHFRGLLCAGCRLIQGAYPFVSDSQFAVSMLIPRVYHIIEGAHLIEI